MRTEYYRPCSISCCFGVWYLGIMVCVYRSIYPTFTLVPSYQHCCWDVKVMLRPATVGRNHVKIENPRIYWLTGRSTCPAQVRLIVSRPAAILRLAHELKTTMCFHLQRTAQQQGSDEQNPQFFNHKSPSIVSIIYHLLNATSIARSIAC